MRLFRVETSDSAYNYEKKKQWFTMRQTDETDAVNWLRSNKLPLLNMELRLAATMQAYKHQQRAHPLITGQLSLSIYTDKGDPGTIS